MPQIQAQILITMTDDGQINIKGPLQNRLLCYGMLEMARDIVHAQATKTGPQLVVAPAGSIPPAPTS